MTGKAWKGSPRRNASSAKQDRCQKVWSVIKSNPREDSTGKGEYKGSIRQRGSIQCYHRIECSATNPLATLIWKWYLNSGNQPYSYSQRLQEGADETKIKWFFPKESRPRHSPRRLILAYLSLNFDYKFSSCCNNVFSQISDPLFLREPLLFYTIFFLSSPLSTCGLDCWC